MTNAELIEALRICANQTCCDNCPRYDIDHTQDAQRCCIQLINDTADALEAAEKRIEQLERDLKTREAEREIMQDTIKICEEAADRYKAQIPKEGKWIQMNGHRYCNVCGHKDSPILTNYCPNCGAKMKGANDGES